MYEARHSFYSRLFLTNMASFLILVQWSLRHLAIQTAAGLYPMESLAAMKMIVNEADNIIDSGKGGVNRNIDTSEALVDVSSMAADRGLHAVAKSSVKSARDLGAKLIMVITKSGKMARFVASHRPTVPVLAFCTDMQVARRLQLHRGVTPVLLQTTLDPLKAGAMAGLRAESMRTALEMGFARAGDTVITVDRTIGGPQDMHQYSFNMKFGTLKEN